MVSFLGPPRPWPNPLMSGALVSLDLAKPPGVRSMEFASGSRWSKFQAKSFNQLGSTSLRLSPQCKHMIFNLSEDTTRISNPQLLHRNSECLEAAVCLVDRAPHTVNSHTCWCIEIALCSHRSNCLQLQKLYVIHFEKTWCKSCHNSQALQQCYQVTWHLVHVFVFEIANSDFLALASATKSRNPTKNCRLLVQIFSNITAEVLAKERYVWPNCMTPSVENISWISCWQDRTGFKIIQILHGALAYHLATDKTQSLPPHQENWCAMSPLALFTKARISFATTQSFHTNHETQISFQITLCAQHLVAQHVCSIVALDD